MQILYICNEVNLRSGWGTVNYHTIQQALGFGHRVRVLTAVGARNIPLEGVSYIPILTSLSDRRVKKWGVYLDGLIASRYANACDLVHILIEPYLPLAAFIKSCRVFFQIHGTYSVAPFKGIHRTLYLDGLRSVDTIVSNSHYTAEQFKKNSGYSEEVFVLGLGVDCQVFQPNAETARKPSILLVGHLKPRKGVMNLIRAFKSVAGEFPQARLDIVGPRSFDRYEQQCECLIQDFNLKEKVVFHGAVDNERLRYFYQTSCVNALPSVNVSDHFEGFGLIHLEANACGLTSVGSLMCGNEDAIEDGISGFLCPQDNVARLEEVLLHLIEKLGTTYYDSLSTKARKHAERRTWKVYFRRLNKLYLYKGNDGVSKPL